MQRSLLGRLHRVLLCVLLHILTCARYRWVCGVVLRASDDERAAIVYIILDRARIAYRRSPAIRRHTLSGIARTSMCVAVHKNSMQTTEQTPLHPVMTTVHSLSYRNRGCHIDSFHGARSVVRGPKSGKITQDGNKPLHHHHLWQKSTTDRGVSVWDKAHWRMWYIYHIGLVFAESPQWIHKELNHTRDKTDVHSRRTLSGNRSSTINSLPLPHSSCSSITPTYPPNCLPTTYLPTYLTTYTYLPPNCLTTDLLFSTYLYLPTNISTYQHHLLTTYLPTHPPNYRHIFLYPTCQHTYLPA